MKKFISITYVLFFSMLIAMPAIAVETEVYPSRAATETVAGEVELATDAETVTGTATDKVTTPANITAKMAAPGEIGGTTPAPATFTDLESISDLFTVGRDTDGYVSLFLERRYAGKYDWLLKAGSRFEIYGGDGNGTVPTDLRFRINDDGSVDMFAGMNVTGPILASTYFNAVDGYVFEDGQTGDTWFWMGQTSDNDAVDDDLWYMGKGNSIGTGSFMSIDGDGNLDSNGTAQFRFDTVEKSADNVTLTALECTDTLITNKDWGGANDQIFTLPDADTSVGEGLKFKLLIVDASGGTADCYLDPEGSTTKIYLDGTALTDGHQVWTQQPAVGESITCHTFTIDGTTYDWACDSCNGIWENKGS